MSRKTYDAHLFVCTNRKAPGPDGKPRTDCASRGAEALREQVKLQASKNITGSSVRVNASGCLGACEEGIAAVCYGSKGGAQWHWGLDPTPESAEILFKSLESISSKSDLDPRNHES